MKGKRAASLKGGAGLSDKLEVFGVVRWDGQMHSGVALLVGMIGTSCENALSNDDPEQFLARAQVRFPVDG